VNSHIRTRRKPLASYSKSANRTRPAPADRVLYLYAISQIPRTAAPGISAEGIDGVSSVEAIRCDKYLCWVSRVAKSDFADNLPDRMQDLEWLASAGLRHQRVVAEISEKLGSLPARFGTVYLTEKSLEQHVKGRQSVLREAFKRVSDADEWGIKVFAMAHPQKSSATAPASGADYLKQKAQMLRPKQNKQLDEDIRRFVAALTKLAVAVSPGGKASAGQPGLVWHGSFLVRRKDRRKLETTLKKHAAEWAGLRRIDWSGPWPPYSFVGEHGD
jgi:hypothetical protein